MKERSFGSLGCMAITGWGFLYPPLEGEGRFACSEAECETGWGDLSTRALFDEERPSPHPAAHFVRVDPPPPGEGKCHLTAGLDRTAFRVPSSNPHNHPAKSMISRHAPSRAADIGSRT